ncbi:ferritin-like fold-containing protein [Georgenia sunbinii]|uniref:ferritin-like fold-containing protein n=1 Tax=Georgenia sunbinii TaxID=3117728 RepID=UPI002F26BC71
MPTTVAVLGFVAADRLTAFSWLAEDAAHAPDVVTRESLSRLAAGQLAGDVSALLAELGADPATATVPHLRLLEEMGARTTPSDWWERLMRSVVVGGMVRDLETVLLDQVAAVHRARAATVPDPVEPMADLLAPAIGGDERLRARLALWGRRVAGEALGLVHPAMSSLGEDGAGLVAPALSAMSGGHARRMDRLRLTA